ncbi:hypothetical protein [Rubrobacter indicoceani]|uniref:hypothetical protein n=1 Tax=Rubrobacter indicoceani TaxID=2051957 RepID=UPI000E5BAC71|nr:hypothetical protein [Rubrobacter indicoceani]
MAFVFIFVVVRGCVATQESTEIRKYVTSSDSLLSESSALGNERLQATLADAGGDPQNVDAGVVNQVANESELLYEQALGNQEVPTEFEGADSYLVSSLGIRAEATRDLANALETPDTFQETLADSTESYRLSDGMLRNHYFPAVGSSLESVGQVQDQSFLEEPPPFMDYEETGFDVGLQNAVGTRNDPNALHGVEVTSTTVAGQDLYPGGEVVLTGDDVPTFSVTVTNGGEVPETAVPVEVILNTSAERQAQTATIERIDANGGTATVEVSGFRPGEVDETAEVTVEVGPVQYEEFTDNNTLAGFVTFGV